MNKRYECYLAAGWFNPTQQHDLSNMRTYMSTHNYSYYDPERMCLCPPDADSDFATFVLEENKKRIAEADFVLANIRHRDLGTVWEVGYAMALGKLVIFWDTGCPLIRKDMEMLDATDFASCTDRDVVVCNTTDKNPVEVAKAGWAVAKGKRVIYYAPGLPAGAQFNLMLAKSGIAVCTSEDDVADCLAKAVDLSWSRPYEGAIE